VPCSENQKAAAWDHYCEKLYKAKDRAQTSQQDAADTKGIFVILFERAKWLQALKTAYSNLPFYLSFKRQKMLA